MMLRQANSRAFRKFPSAAAESAKPARWLLLLIFLLLPTLLVPDDAGAQGGRIIGRVLDSDSGRGLVGAQVVVVGTTTGTIAGVDGRYILVGVAGGDVALRVTYLGYAETTVTGLEVAPGGVLTLDVALTTSAVALEGITVSAGGERGTLARAMDEQRTSTNVVSAITSEQISRSPDGDAAAAIQRVSGVTVQDGKFIFVRGLGERYTTTSLNGSRVPSPEPERRMVPLDLFPSGLLQTITTSKTFTPNLSGDFSGAQVDIRTREYPAGRQMAISMSQGFNSAVTGAELPMAPRAGGEWLAAAVGPRALPLVVENTTRPQPGPQTNAMVNAMRNAWSVDRRYGRPSSSMSLSLGGSEPVGGQDVGYLLSTTYSLSDEANAGTIRENVEGDRYEGDVGRTSVLLGGLFNLSTLIGHHSRLAINNIYNRTADNEATLETGFYENHGTRIQIERLRYVERTLRSTQLMAKHQLHERHQLDWSVNVSAVSRQEPDRSEYVTWLDPATPIWYNQEGAFRAFGGLTEESLELLGDYRIDLGRTRSSALRFGGLLRATDRDAYDTGYSIRSREWTPTDGRWQARPEEFFDGRNAADADRLFELGIFNAGGAYQATDRLSAGYGMFEWGAHRRVRVVGGARIEHSAVEVAYEDVLGTRGTAAPTYTDVLPSLALNVDVADAQKVRLSLSQTLARPEYREIAPICYRAGLGEEQRCGNPDLVRTLIRNADLRWEYYPSPGEVLSVAFFAKHFDRPVEPRYQGRSGTSSLWFENALSATNYGVEVEATGSLGFLSPRLDPFAAFANTTWMRSDVRTAGENDVRRAMTGQAPYVVNAGLTWTGSETTSATLLFNVVGERVINARPSGSTVPDVLELPRPGLDLAFRFPFLGGLAAKVDAKNLLDWPYEVTQGDLVRRWYRSGRSLSFGISWRN